jgi:hypothetical protein
MGKERRAPLGAEPLEHRNDLPQRQPHRMETHPEHLTGVGVRSLSQTSSQSTFNVSLSRSPSSMSDTRYDLLIPQATSTIQCPLSQDIDW